MLNSIEATMQTEGLLKQSQQLATELQTQQKELQQTNEQLAQKAQQLAEQNYEVERKNQEIEQARRALEEKARELALTSKYKSEFLANMSHELRTPLNSILVLGQQLAENPDGSLTPKQVEFARTIHGAGTDLLNLISDILDLSKIESGTVSVEAEEVFFGSAARHRRAAVPSRSRKSQASLRGHERSAHGPQPGHGLQAPAAGAQESAFECVQVHRARKREVVRIAGCRAAGAPDHPILSGAGSVIAFEVSDTGIGIPPEKQRIIFEAFQQADAGTSRKYGGTGLGLAISRELANLLGGEIQLRSAARQGKHLHALSAADLRRPRGCQLSSRRKERAERFRYAGVPFATWRPSSRKSRIEDDRNNLEEGDAVLLIVEDDPHYARVLCDLSRDKGFKVLVAHDRRGGTVAGARVPSHRNFARCLPARHAGLDGPESSQAGFENAPHSGADAHARRRSPSRPVARRIRLRHQANVDRRSRCGADAHSRVLAAAPQAAAGGRRQSRRTDEHHANCWGTRTSISTSSIPAPRALQALERETYDCVVLDLRLPDMTGFEVLEQTSRHDPSCRTCRWSSSPAGSSRRKKMRNCIRWRAASWSRMLNRPSGCSTRRRSSCIAWSPICRQAKQQMLDRLHRSDDALAGRKVLVVDDDVRNIFALSSVLERRGMTVLSAGTGREAIETIESTPDLAIVLMDIMMPEMDGYETMQVIRQNPALRRLPIIALTAKAMKGDRERCLEAGASEYLAKPVNTEQLLSALRMWLHR